MASHRCLHAPAQTISFIRLRSARSHISQVSVTAIDVDTVASQEVTLQVPNGGSDVTAQINTELGKLQGKGDVRVGWVLLQVLDADASLVTAARGTNQKRNTFFAAKTRWC